VEGKRGEGKREEGGANPSILEKFLDPPTPDISEVAENLIHIWNCNYADC